MKRGATHVGVLALWALFNLLPQAGFALSKREPLNKIPDLNPPLDLMAPTFWEQHGATVAVAGGVGLGLAALAIWLLRRPQPIVATPPDVAARQALEALRGRDEDGPLLAQVSAHLRHYVLAALRLPAGELTTEELASLLRARPEVPPELSVALSGLLRECDARKFAPVQPAPTPGMVDRALELAARFAALRPPASPSAAS
ncbi:MAG: hypothetical protein HZA90_01275 [Verrucomicrobia bacterium]|nr:hypothetical protein [Verrucomicrobiota bacterium]